MANVLPLRVAQRLNSLYQIANQSAQAFNDSRSIALEMLGLDPTQQYGIDFATGLIQEPPQPFARSEVPPGQVSSSPPSEQASALAVPTPAPLPPTEEAPQ